MSREHGLASLVDVMLARIAGRRDPVSGAVEQALRQVPRHLFVPPVALIASGDVPAFVIDRDVDPDGWLAAVYAEGAIVTQLDEGTTDLRSLVGGFTSSNSAPATVADLLELLDPSSGHRVLEIGTGTGWTAALLSHLVGERNVTSIEVDSALAGVAAKNLGEAGVQPHLVVGDGADGWAERAPYDGVHATCAVHTVPYAWVEQTRPGGVIVAPFATGFGEGHALRLVVAPDGSAHGAFRRFASYMAMRSQRFTYLPEPEDAPVSESTTRIDPRTIACAPPGARLAMAALTGLHMDSRDEPGRFAMWLSSPDDPGERAMIAWERDAAEYPVFQIGDRPVWEEVVDAYFRWVAWGEPGRGRFGMTVTPEGGRVWLDSPERVVGPD